MPSGILLVRLHTDQLYRLRGQGRGDPGDLLPLEDSGSSAEAEEEVTGLVVVDTVWVDHSNLDLSEISSIWSSDAIFGRIGL